MRALAKQNWLAVLSGLLLALSFPLSLPPLPTGVAAWLNFDLPTTPALGSIPIPLPNPLMPQTPEQGYVQIPWLAFFALVPLLLALRRVERPAQALWLGFLAGAVWNTLDLFWFRDFGALAVVCMSFYFALPVALFAYLAWWVAWGPEATGSPRSLARRSLWGTAALWTALEYLKSFGFWAFPWLLAGYSQAHFPLMIQSADIGGVYLVGFLLALSNTALAALLSSRLSARQRLANASMVTLVLAGNFAYGYWRLSSIPKPLPTVLQAGGPALSAMPSLAEAAAGGPESLRIALIQGGQSSREDWTLAKQDEAAKAYVTPSQQVLNAAARRAPAAGSQAAEVTPRSADTPAAGPASSVQPPPGPASRLFLPDQRSEPRAVYRDASSGTLLVWPESCLVNNDIDPKRLNHLPINVRTLLSTHPGSALIFGSIGRPHQERRFENGCMLLEPRGQVKWPYSKIRLVPYGEVVPFREVVRFMDYPWGDADVSEGRGFTPVEWKGHKLGPMICFDNVFGFVPRGMVKAGAQYLLLLTNNSWYTLRSGIRQHCDLDLLRAVENRRPLARVSTTGWSHTVDAAGRVVAETNAGCASILQDRLSAGPPPLLPGWAQSLLAGATGKPAAQAVRGFKLLREPLYVNIGDLFAQLCLLWAVFLALPPMIRGRSEAFL